MAEKYSSKEVSLKDDVTQLFRELRRLHADRAALQEQIDHQMALEETLTHALNYVAGSLAGRNRIQVVARAYLAKVSRMKEARTCVGYDAAEDPKSPPMTFTFTGSFKMTPDGWVLVGEPFE